jgi:Fe2+ or Zn2+ uptake regulation protein
MKETQSGVTYNKTNSFDMVKNDPNDGPSTDRMGKQDRQRVMLEFMEEHPLAYPPSMLYQNLRLFREITFSENTVRNYLKELSEEGLIARVKRSELENARLVEADPGDHAVYIITEEGCEHIRDEFQ